MTLTTQEVCSHAAPIAALLGTEIVLRDCGLGAATLFVVSVDGYLLDPEPAMSLILGRIVAKCAAFELDCTGLSIESETGEQTIRREDDEPPLFVRACRALALAHNLTPAKEAP